MPFRRFFEEGSHNSLGVIQSQRRDQCFGGFACGSPANHRLETLGPLVLVMPPADQLRYPRVCDLGCPRLFLRRGNMYYFLYYFLYYFGFTCETSFVSQVNWCGFPVKLVSL